MYCNYITEKKCIWFICHYKENENIQMYTVYIEKVEMGIETNV